MKVYLVGFMGCGKSTVGPLVADSLDLAFLDLDRQIEESTGRTIPEIFNQQGEAFFREEERRLLRDLSGRDQFVMALGGGAYADQANREFIRAQGQAVWLKISLETALRRGRTESRPLAANREQFERLYQQRAQAYSEADVVIDCECLSPEEVSLRVVHELREGRSS